jgi:hypothetical protein
MMLDLVVVHSVGRLDMGARHQMEKEKAALVARLPKTVRGGVCVEGWSYRNVSV